MDFNGTPRARPALKFANRVYTSSPQSSTKRLGTPQGATRKAARFDESSLSRNAGNIFRASAMPSAPTPYVSRFEPKLSSNTIKKTFAPSASADNSDPKQRVYRETIAKFTPRGLASHSNNQELFDMRIPSPPPELNGEELSKRVPGDLESRGTVYADQYLSHVVPKEFDDLQRRQFFCILDLRRLKYAANEVFVKKDWKLNIMNFAKEFEKSRSLILLRYGLYKFQNVKPSQDVLRRWKISHGLPVDEGEDETVAKSSVSGSKRKAEDDTTPSRASLGSNKRRLFDEDEDGLPPSKSEDIDDQPRKILKPLGSSTSGSTPSATRALFEKIASKSASDASSAPGLFASTAKPAPSNPFSAASNTNANADDDENDSVSDDEEERDVDADATTKSANGPSIFEKLSKGYDASSSRDNNSGSGSAPAFKFNSDTAQKKVWTPDTPIKFAPTAPAPASSSSSNLFASTAPTTSAPTTAISLFGTQPAIADTASTPSLFGAKKPEEPKKIAPTNISDKPASSLFGAAKPATEAPKPLFGAIPAPEPAASSNLFGAKPDAAAPLFASKTEAPAAASIFASKTETPATTSIFASKTETPTTAPLFGSKPDTAASGTTASLFGAKPDAPAATTSIFGASAPAPAATTSSAPLFGAASSPAPTPAAPSTPLFAAKPAESKPEEAATTNSLFSKAAQPEPGVFSFGVTKPAESSAPGSGLFGSSVTNKPASTTAATATPLFGAAPAPAASTATTGLFGSKPADKAAEAEKPKSLFGATPAADAPPASGLFGGANGSSNSNSNILFGAGKPSLAPPVAFDFSAPKPAAAESKPLFGSNPIDGSPMKQDSPTKRALDQDNITQDGPPVAKKLFGASTSAAAAPAFSFGATTSATPTPNTSFNFGASQTTNANPSSQTTTGGSGIFGGAGSSFTFNAGAPTTSSANNSFSNPFQGANNGPVANGASSVPSFNFAGAGNSSASATPNSSFQFGGASQESIGSTGNMFSFNASTTNTTPGRVNASLPPGKRATLVPKSRRGRSNSPAVSQGNGSSLPNPFASGTGSATPSFTFGNNGVNDTPATTDNDAAAAKDKEVSNGLSSTLAVKPPTTTATAAPTSLFGSTTTPATTSLFSTTTTSTLALTATATPTAPTPTPTVAAPAGGDDADAPQEQINLTEGGPGEEDEEVVFEVRAKMLLFVKDPVKSSWSTEGVGPLRVMKHKTKGSVRLLLRKEPSGQIAFNRSLLASSTYVPNGKTVKLTTTSADGTGFETWVATVKTPESAASLAEALEKHKVANKKD